MPRIKSTHIAEPVAVGKRLKEARERAGLTQRRLAFPGCSSAYISRVEAGDRVPSPKVLEGLAERLSVTASWLATGMAEADESLLRDGEIALRLDEIDQAEECFSRVLREERRELRSQALAGLAQIALRKGDPRRAVDLGEEVLALTGKQPEELPSLAESLARAYAELGEMAPAIAVLRRCLERSADDAVQFVRFSMLLGAALTDGGDFQEAERVIGEALARGREISDPYSRARLYWSQSRLLVEEGRSDAAENYAQRTLELLRATEDDYAIGHILQTLAHINIDLGRPEAALEFLREGWPKITAAASPVERTQFRIEEARALAKLGKTDDARSLAIELSTALGDVEPLDSGRAYAMLAETFAIAGDNARAQELYELAIERLEQRPWSRYLVEAYKQYAALLREEGDIEAALEFYERVLNVQRQVGRPLA